MYTFLDMVQYVFAMYMDMFLLYLILRFTKPNQSSELPSIAFLENSHEVKAAV